MWQDIGIIIGVPVLRSVAGWAAKALEDKKITRYEWKKLTQTVIKVGTMGALGYIGLDMAGVENAALAAGVGSFFADKIFNAMKQTNNVTKR